MKVIYIAGAYRDRRGEWFVRQNIRRAEAAAEFVWQHGAVALCPHKNTAGFGGLPGCPDDTWLQGDLELLKRCDAVWMLTGWKDSAGASVERDFAVDNGIPVLYTTAEVSGWLKKNSG